MKGKSVKLGISIMIVAISSVTHAKKIYPAEIMGRDLNYPGLGWLGHVGIATANTIGENANLVIEILHVPVVGQLNILSNFKARSAYWGSKYGKPCLCALLVVLSLFTIQFNQEQIRQFSFNY